MWFLLKPVESFPFLGCFFFVFFREKLRLASIRLKIIVRKTPSDVSKKCG